MDMKILSFEVLQVSNDFIRSFEGFARHVPKTLSRTSGLRPGDLKMIGGRRMGARAPSLSGADAIVVVASNQTKCVSWEVLRKRRCEL
jgi:hypothetical protein